MTILASIDITQDRVILCTKVNNQYLALISHGDSYLLVSSFKPMKIYSVLAYAKAQYQERLIQMLEQSVEDQINQAIERVI